MGLGEKGSKTLLGSKTPLRFQAPFFLLFQNPFILSSTLFPPLQEPFKLSSALFLPLKNCFNYQAPFFLLHKNTLRNFQMKHPVLPTLFDGKCKYSLKKTFTIKLTATLFKTSGSRADFPLWSVLFSFPRTTALS